jgi:hypothetical protein
VCILNVEDANILSYVYEVLKLKFLTSSSMTTASRHGLPIDFESVLLKMIIFRITTSYNLFEKYTGI